MKVVVITHKPCHQFYELFKEYINELEYIGFSIQKHTVVHYFKTKKRLVRLPCKDCILRKLLSTSALVDHPRFENGVFVFKFVYTNALSKLLGLKDEELYTPSLKAYTVSARKLLLTARQRCALRLFVQGGLRKVAEALGVSKPTACRVVKRALKKLAN